jgi:hypothetical protein
MQGSASLIQSMCFDIMASLKPHSLIKIIRNFEWREGGREGGRHIFKFSNKLKFQKEFT